MWKIKCTEMLINSVKDHVEKVKVNIPVMTVHHFIALNNCSVIKEETNIMVNQMSKYICNKLIIRGK